MFVFEIPANNHQSGRWFSSLMTGQSESAQIKKIYDTRISQQEKIDASELFKVRFQKGDLGSDNRHGGTEKKIKAIVILLEASDQP